MAAANPVAPTPELTLQAEKTSSEMLVRCRGKITSGSSGLLKATVTSLMLENRIVVLDLGNVSYVDSSGLGALVGLYISSRRTSCSLKLRNLTDRLKELLHLTRLNQFFEGS
ncbi:MAG: STAS domain-containing protein [Terriglobales bacterium]